jgi:hypothetical protein
VIPQPEQPIISTKEIFMPSSPTVAATSLDELLTYHDADFIHCAYITLLGRAPDPEGIRYYLGRIRAGRSKTALIAQLASSVEAKHYNANVVGLNQVLSRYRWEKIPLLGLWIRSINRVDEIARQMSVMENSTYLLKKEMNSRFDTVEQTIKNISYTVIASSDSNAVTKTNYVNTENSNLSHLSPSARKIYRMLKNVQGSR